MSKYISGIKGTNFTINNNGISNNTGLSTLYTSTGVYTGISGSTNAGMELVAASGSALSFIDFSYVNVDYRGRIMYNHTANSMTFSTNVATAMTLNSAGDMAVVGQVNGREGLNASFYSGLIDSSSYNMMMRGANDGGDKFVMFINGTDRIGEGGANAATIRNEGGSIRLGSSSYITLLEGNDITLTSAIYALGGSINLMSGHVGIGTSSPQSALHITGEIHTSGSNKGVHGGMFISTDATLSLVSDTSSNKSDILFGYTGNRHRGFISYDHPSNTMNFHTNGSFAAKVSINSVGSLTSNINTDVSFYAPTCLLSNYNMVLRGGNDTGDKLVVYVNGSDRNNDGPNNGAIIRNEGGSMTIGSPSYDTIIEGAGIYIKNGLRVYNGTFTSTNVSNAVFGGPGTPAADTNLQTVSAEFDDAIMAVAFYSVSDIRIKENINSITNTELLTKLNPVTYHLIDKSKDNNLQYGLIAQEVKEIIPEVVTSKPGHLPNIMTLCKCIDKNKIEIDTKSVDIDLLGKKLLIYVENDPESRKECKIISVDDNYLTVDKCINPLSKSDQQVYVYGTYDNIMSIQYEKFVPLLIKDSQQKSEQINKLESEINNLKTLMQSLIK